MPHRWTSAWSNAGEMLGVVDIAMVHVKFLVVLCHTLNFRWIVGCEMHEIFCGLENCCSCLEDICRCSAWMFVVATLTIFSATDYGENLYAIDPVRRERALVWNDGHRLLETRVPSVVTRWFPFWSLANLRREVDQSIMCISE